MFHAFKGTISRWEQGGIEDGVAVLNAIKHTDSYLSMVDGKDRTSEENKAKQALNRIGEYQSHNYWDDHKVITTDDVMAKHNADLQDAISKVNVKEESEVMDSKKIAMRYKEFMKKSGSKEKAIDIAEPSSGKPMTVLKNDGKLKRQIPGHVGSYDTDVSEAYQKKTAYQKLNTRMKTVTGKSLDDRSKEMDKIKQDTLDRISQYKKDGVIKNEETELEEAAPFKTKEDAVKYAKDKVKTHRDNLDGIEIHSHSGGFDVNHTSNSSGRNSLQKIGAKHLGTIYKEDVDLEEAEQIDELSTDLLGKYKAAAGKNAKAADESGNYKKGDKRFAGINKATRKQFDNDLKKHGQFKESKLNPADPHTDYKAKSKALQDIQLDPNTHKDPEMVKALIHRKADLEKEYAKIKEDIYSSDTRTKKVQVQDKDGNWVFKDRKSHPHKINFAASKMNGKPAQVNDPTKVDTETNYQNYLDKQKKQNEAWVLNPDGKTKKKYKDIKDNKTLSISNTAPFDAFSNTNNQT